MVLLRSLLLAVTATLSVAQPLEAIVRRGAPNKGDELELKKTKNDKDEAKWEEDGDVKIKVGERLGGGSKGEVYAVDCDGEDDCEDWDKVVVKWYKQQGIAEEERQALARIDELKAVGKKDNDEYTVMKQWEGTKFQDLPKYVEWSADKAANKDAINKLVESTIKKVIEVGEKYVKDSHIYHADITDVNVLLQGDEEIDSAALIDWDVSNIVPKDDWSDEVEAELLAGIKDQAELAFGGKYRVA